MLNLAAAAIRCIGVGAAGWAKTPEIQPSGDPSEMTRGSENATTTTRRTLCKALALAPLAAPFVGLSLERAHAQAAYPTRPVRFVLPFGAGGVADVTSRLTAEKLGEKLGQRF